MLMKRAGVAAALTLALVGGCGTNSTEPPPARGSAPSLVKQDCRFTLLGRQSGIRVITHDRLQIDARTWQLPDMHEPSVRTLPSASFVLFRTHVQCGHTSTLADQSPWVSGTYEERDHSTHFAHTFGVSVGPFAATPPPGGTKPLDNDEYVAVRVSDEVTLVGVRAPEQAPDQSVRLSDIPVMAPPATSVTLPDVG